MPKHLFLKYISDELPSKTLNLSPDHASINLISNRHKK